jgi:hypothetical protein
MPHELRITAQLEMHLPEDNSKVHLELRGGVGLAGGEVFWGIPTRCIPPHPRKTGCRFLVMATSVSDGLEAAGRTAEEIRAARSVRVLDLE